MNAQQWLKHVIRIRKKLIASNLSKKTIQMINDLSFLQQHLTANRYSDVTIASFFIRHSDKIYNILPGEGSGNHKQLAKEFNEILNECQNICKPIKPAL